MEERDLICINCPMGCNVHVELENGEIVTVTGNTCPRGDAYARSEVTNPTRIVTSIVPVENGEVAMVSCKTDRPVEKAKIFEVIDALADVKVQAPVHIGDVLLANAAGTDADIIATKEVSKL